VAFRVVLDANVLYPASLRDSLLRLAERELYDLYWSDRILEEVTRNLIEDGRASPVQAERLVEHMTSAFDAACVPENEIRDLEDAMRNDPKDRHVLAAAVAIDAETVVTRNTKDCPAEVCSTVGVEILDPDDFLLVLYEIDPSLVYGVIVEQAADLLNPPMSLDELLGHLSQSAPRFSEAIAQYHEQHETRTQN
jgi:predicted nucleic acid-binding protein